MEIVTDWNLDFKNHYKLVLRSYMETHEYPNITNNLNLITNDFIDLVPTTNLKGIQKVF